MPIPAGPFARWRSPPPSVWRYARSFQTKCSGPDPRKQLQKQDSHSKALADRMVSRFSIAAMRSVCCLTEWVISSPMMSCRRIGLPGVILSVQPELRIAAQKRGNALVVLPGPLSQPSGKGFGKADGDGNSGFFAAQSCLLSPENAVRQFFGTTSKIIPVKSVESTAFQAVIPPSGKTAIPALPRKAQLLGG